MKPGPPLDSALSGCSLGFFGDERPVPSDRLDESTEKAAAASRTNIVLINTHVVAALRSDQADSTASIRDRTSPGNFARPSTRTSQVPTTALISSNGH